jgi:hypothetical protein
MKRSRAATVSKDKKRDHDAPKHSGPRATSPPGHAMKQSTQAELAEKRRPERKEKVPENARLWGFVRHLSLEETLKGEANKSAIPAEHDAKLLWDVDRHRFLIVSEQAIVDDLSPLQFVQFVRELRDVTSRILFKFERRDDGSTGRAYRVWS